MEVIQLNAVGTTDSATYPLGRIGGLYAGHSDYLVAVDADWRPFVWLFDQAALAPVAAFGRSDEPPNGFQAPVLAGADSVHVHVYDRKLQRITRWAIADLVAFGDRARPDSIISASSFPPTVLEVSKGGPRYWAAGLLPDQPLLSLDDTTLHLAPMYPDSEIPLRGRFLLNRTRMSAHPSDSQSVAFAFQYSNLLYLTTSVGTKVVRGPREVVVRYRTDRRGGQERFGISPASDYGYVAVMATANRIYALHCGRCSADDEQGAAELHIFDWTGRLRHMYTFDRHVTAIAPSHDDVVIYASFSRPYAGIARYEFPPPHVSLDRRYINDQEN